MRKSDLETPKTVRNWINFVTEKGNSWKYPSYSEFRRFIGGINTNWVKFYHHVEPEGLEQVVGAGSIFRFLLIWISDWVLVSRWVTS